MTSSFRRAAGTLAAGLLFACSTTAPGPTAPTLPLAPGQVLATNATIRFSSIEGGCWSIQTTEGQRYQPVNLGAAFRTNGLAVRVVLRDAPKAVGFCPLAPFVTIDSISPS